MARRTADIDALESRERIHKSDPAFWWEHFHQMQGPEEPVHIPGFEWEVVSQFEGFVYPFTHQQVSMIIASHEARKISDELDTQFNSDAPYKSWPAELKTRVFALVKSEEQKTQLEAMVSKSNMKLHQVLTLIVSAVSGKYGFAHREWFPLCATEAEVEARAIAMGAFYLESLLKKKAWNDLDGLIVSSSMLPEDLSEKILQFAKLVGILSSGSQPVLRDVRLACSSSAATFVLALTDPKLKDAERLGLVSLDPLADYFRVHPGHLCLERLQEIAVFSSGSGAVAFSPKDLELGESTTIIVGPDDTTQFRKFYSFEDTKPLPPELINFFSGDTASITTQGDDDHMAMLLNMPLPDDDTMGKFGDQRKLMGFIVKSLKTVLERTRRNASTTTMNEKILFVTNAASKDMTERFAALAKVLGYNFETVFYPFGNASGSSLLKHLEMAANAWVNDSETPAAIVLATTAVGNSMSFVELRLKEEQNSRVKNDGTS